jgi:hypothetical protein
LAAHQLHARPSMKPPAPVPPEEGSRADDEWMQQHTHPARLGGGSAMPLTLLPQGTGTATADAGRIHHAQASIGGSRAALAQRATARQDSAAFHPAGG